LGRIVMGRVLPFVAGILEFFLCALMFLMAAFALTGYFVVSYMPSIHDVAIAILPYLGILAIFAFVFGLAGSVSAIERWSLFVSVFGASLVACWGLLYIWYSLAFLIDPDDIQTGVTLGTIAVFFSMLVIILVVATKESFKPHALARASSS